MEIPWNFCVKKPWGISVRVRLINFCVVDVIYLIIAYVKHLHNSIT